MKTAKAWAELLREVLSERRVHDEWEDLVADIEKMFDECQNEAMREAYDRAADARRPG